MAKLTKRQKAIAEKVVAGKQYSFEEAAKLLAEPVHHQVQGVRGRCREPRRRSA